MKTFNDQVIGLHLLPNDKAIQVWFSSGTTAEEPQIYDLNPGTKLTVDGHGYVGWESLLAWFSGDLRQPGDKTVPYCEVEYDDADPDQPIVRSAKFTRK